MMLTNATAKMQGGAAGLLGGFASGELLGQVTFAIFPTLAVDPWDDITIKVIGVLLALAGALYGIYKPRNALTTKQVVMASEAGELAPAIAGIASKTDATLVAVDLASTEVKDGLAAAGVPMDILKPKTPPKPAPAPKGRAR